MGLFSRMDTPAQQQARLVKLHTRKVLFDVTDDPFLLMEVVAAGPDQWRVTAREAFEPYGCPPEQADAMFAFFCAAVQARFGAGAQAPDTGGFQSEHVEAALIAGDFLDACSPVTPPTPAEIARQWTVEDGSSDAAKRLEYAETGLHPQEMIDKLAKLPQES